MKVGLTNIYAFRPHVEHLFYLEQMLRKAGHDTYLFSCPSIAAAGYPKLLKDSQYIKEWLKVRLGGVESFRSKNLTIASMQPEKIKYFLSKNELYNITLSSSCTLHRTESNDEYNDEQLQKTRQYLKPYVEQVYNAAMLWIEKNNLQGVICFNGRMELTRAVTYACEKKGIPYITHERTWWGHGLLLTPNANCLSLYALSQMTKDFKDKPLTRQQALYAASLVVSRFLQRNELEWRVYNKDAQKQKWPLDTKGAKILVLPSSRNESAGHAELELDWQDNTQALDDFLQNFSIDNTQVVVRFHPNWAEMIGAADGKRAIELYTNWCKNRRIFFIGADEKANTQYLIEQADIIVVNGGSAAVEAGILGKKIISLAPAGYNDADFVESFLNKESMRQKKELSSYNPKDVIRKTLRFLYVSARRHPQFVNYIRAITTTRYRYFQGADVNRMISMFQNKTLLADDNSYASSQEEENKVISLIQNKKWDEFKNFHEQEKNLQPLKLKRRISYFWVDMLREFFPRGDL